MEAKQEKIANKIPKEQYFKQMLLQEDTLEELFTQLFP